MAREVYTSKKYLEFSKKFVFLRVFADTNPEGNELRKRYRIQGYQTLLILDSRGRELDRILGARSEDQLIEELELIFKFAAEDKTNGGPVRL